MEPTSKERILAAARTLFGELGYADTTFKRIAERSSVALGLITHHFGSKEKLFVTSSLSVLDEVTARVLADADREECGLDRVVRFVSTYLDCSVSVGADFLILVRCSPYSDLISGLSKEEITGRFELLIRELAKRIEQGVADGTIVSCDPMRRANVVFATIVGSVRTRLLSPFCPENFYHEVVTCIGRGLASNRT